MSTEGLRTESRKSKKQKNFENENCDSVAESNIKSYHTVPLDSSNKSKKKHSEPLDVRDLNIDQQVYN